MKITIAAVGKAKADDMRSLTQTYLTRNPWNITITEVSAKSSLATEARMQAEADLLLKAVDKCHALIVLDERGKSLTSQKLADTIQQWQVDGRSHLGIIIGGADGVTDQVRNKADLLLAFGAMSWPHKLVRVMLAEQLYRAATLISGHPYHRE